MEVAPQSDHVASTRSRVIPDVISPFLAPNEICSSQQTSLLQLSLTEVTNKQNTRGKTVATGDREGGQLKRGDERGWGGDSLGMKGKIR